MSLVRFHQKVRHYAFVLSWGSAGMVSPTKSRLCQWTTLILSNRHEESLKHPKVISVNKAAEDIQGEPMHSVLESWYFQGA